MESLQVRVPAEGTTLSGELRLPEAPAGLVLLPHAGGNDALGQADRGIPSLLKSRGFGILEIDLLTSAEAEADRNTGWFHLNVPFLADRICLVLAWIRRNPRVHSLPLAIVAKGTTLPACLVSASRHAEQVQAIVSHHGRADLAEEALAQLQSPTLLIADDKEPHLIDLNRLAARKLLAPHRLDVVPRSPAPDDGLAAAARTADWIEEHFAGAQARG